MVQTFESNDDLIFGHEKNRSKKNFAEKWQKKINLSNLISQFDLLASLPIWRSKRK